MKNKRKLLFGVAILMVSLLVSGCGKKSASNQDVEDLQEEKIQIGLSWDTFVLERWIKDRDVFVSTATELGAEVNVQNANGDFEKQLSQIKYLMDKKMDVIVVVAVDTDNTRLNKLINKAQDKGIKIISYDRLICNAGTDLYLSFDNKQVGRLMAQAVIDNIPEGGKIAAIFGPLTDHNILEMESGVQEVLKENNQRLIYRNYAKNWQAEYAEDYVNECINMYGEIDGLICGNDGLVAGAYRELSKRRLAGKVCLVGQDADIDACQRIVEGNQYMTVYKSIMDLAKQAAIYAVSLAKGEDLQTSEVMDDGTYLVPYYKFEPVAVTKENMDEVIVDSQFHFENEVYLYVNE